MLPVIQPLKKMRYAESASDVTRIDDDAGESAIIDTSNKTFLDLNDDCVEEIFDRLSILDLCAITRTCSRLKGIGNRLFERKHKHFNFPIVGEDPTLVQARKLFHLFGSLMLKLKIDLLTYSQSIGTRIIDAVVRYCSTLKLLYLQWYTISDNQDDITKVGLLFKSLETLHLHCVLIENMDYLEKGAILTPKGNSIDFFTNCDSLIDLKVDSFERAVFESNLPKLECFGYYSGSRGVYTEEDYIACNAEGFFSRHKNLKSITLRSIGHHDIVCFLKFIAANCKNLEKFDFTTFAHTADYTTSLKWLETLEHLKELRIYWSHQNVTKLLKDLSSKSLEVLKLKCIQACSQLIPAVSQIKTLRVLKLCGVYDLQEQDLNPLGELHHLTELFIDRLNFRNQRNLKIDLIKMVKRLINLKKFSFYRGGKFTITKNVYLELVGVVENRSESKNRRLKIRCASTNDFDHLLCQTVEFVHYELSPDDLHK